MPYVRSEDKPESGFGFLQSQQHFSVYFNQTASRNVLCIPAKLMLSIASNTSQQNNIKNCTMVLFSIRLKKFSGFIRIQLFIQITYIDVKCVKQSCEIIMIKLV